MRMPCSLCYPVAVPEWRNWQTRRTQNPVAARSRYSVIRMVGLARVRTGDLEEVCAQTCAHFVPTLVRKSFIYVVGCHLMPLVTC